MINVTEEFLVRLKKAGYDNLTPIQKIAIPKILSGKNVLIIAPTGYGKTEAAILPIFYKIFKDRPNKISTLYITPLRALNRDLESRLKKLGMEFEINVKVRHGDSSEKERKEVIENPPDVLIVTPETLLYLILNEKFREYFKNLKWIIIDELQEMLDEKRGIELSVVIQRIKRISKNKVQLIGVSATIGDVDVAKRYLDKQGDVDVAIINSEKDMKIEIIIPNIDKMHIDLALKFDLKPETISRLEKLNEIIENNKPIIIFTNTRETNEFLSSELSNIYGLKVASHHGSLSREIRIKSEGEFKKGNIDAIIATSSLELGIDIGKINLVVQYMSPRQVIRLIQRVGRSGHMIGKISKGYIIPTDDIFDILECKAIVELLRNGYLEKPLIQKNPLDVAAHQIAGMVLEGYRNPKEILNILRESFYFETLTEELFEEILELLESAKIIKKADNGHLLPGGRIWKYYYYTNMIPDSVRSFMVIDYSTNTKIGKLDEEFVAGLDEDSVFILGGKLWKIISIENDKIYVERAELKSGILPSWFGESIPVEKEVAKKVYNYISNYFKEGYSEHLDNNIAEILERYKRKGYPELTQNSILIEIIKNDLIIIHSPFGSRGNNTLGTLFSFLLSKEKGMRTTFRADPYHIVVASVLPLSKKDVENTIKSILSISKNELIEIIRNEIKESPSFKWKLLVEVKRFGMIDPDKEVELTSPIIKAYNNTIVGEEATNELLVKNYDVEIFDELKRYEWKVIEVYEPSPLAKVFLDKILNFDNSPEDKPLLIEVYKKKLESKEVKLICIVCGWSGNYTIINSPNRCPKCSSVFLAAVNIDDEKSLKIVREAIRGGKLRGPERKQLEMLKNIASLFSTYGKYALIALASNGIGPSNLGKVLSKLSEGEDKFYLAIMEEERKFIRTKKYWH
ncbi:DEAD/DEAH box helicase [Saccharolobus caldissimus]|uniref:Helicase n=1 Tax=Saccharolobus caldissimus TaxID=1702097 RepID=A0AAQ4CP85_9CREN|nr:DEAD/DEAH box helicase [Saccharolobus caldissimus]BDB97616.1 helicase [Saccharolobus caldissimus]